MLLVLFTHFTAMRQLRVLQIQNQEAAPSSVAPDRLGEGLFAPPMKNCVDFLGLSNYFLENLGVWVPLEEKHSFLLHGAYGRSSAL